MDLCDYFESANGVGILATSDALETVDAAIYAEPCITDEDTEGYVGKRLYLTKVREKTDSDRIKALKKRHSKIFKPDEINKYVVYFNVDKIRPLVGDET